MQIILDDEKIKYEIHIERSNDRGIPFLITTIIVDNGQETFKGKLSLRREDK